MHHDPLKYFDPDGLSTWDYIAGGASVLGQNIGSAIAARSAICVVGSYCPQAGAAMSTGYAAYGMGSSVYHKWDSVADLGSTFWNEGFSAGWDAIGTGITSRIEDFENLSDYDKGAAAVNTGIALIFAGKGAKGNFGKNPKAPVPKAPKAPVPKAPKPSVPKVPKGGRGTKVWFGCTFRSWASQ